MRIKWSELTADRVVTAVRRRIATVPDKLAWTRSDRGRRNRARLQSLRDRHRGQRCFLMCNGPGLTKLDLSRLAGETTFAFNRAYVAFDSFGFEPTYYVGLNGLLLQQFATDVAELPMPKFLAWDQRRLFPESRGEDEPYFLRTFYSIEDGFNTDVTAGVYSGATVTYRAMQLAFHMGFTDIAIVGMDHNFAHLGTPNQVVREDDRSHFIKNYFPKGTRWELPDLRRTNIAYARARRAFERSGRRIVDASVDGRCDVFDKVSYDDLFQ